MRKSQLIVLLSADPLRLNPLIPCQVVDIYRVSEKPSQ